MHEEVLRAATAPRGDRKKYAASISAMLAVVVIIGICIVVARKQASSANPVPEQIARSVSFPVYYPDQAKLPAGYLLDRSSFTSPVKSGVNYTVTYGNGKKIVFSVQPKPSSNDLQSFAANYIPLHTNYQTPNGQALLGAYRTKSGTETLVSLPTKSSTWVLITAPYDINQAQLKQVLSSLKT